MRPKRFKIEEDTNHEDPSRDAPKTREIKVQHNKLIIQKTGPYGFYRVFYERGVTPKELHGDWIGIEDAKQAIRNYFSANKRMDQIEGQI